MHHRFVPMRKFYIGEEVTAEILVYSDLSDFQLKKLYPDEDTYDIAFAQLMARMQYTYESAIAKNLLNLVTPPFIGMAVAACFSQDKKWYRAEIFELVDQDQVNVIFVDYGNKEKINVNDLKQLLVDFMKYEIQIFRCALHGIEFTNETDLVNATNFFYDTTEKIKEKTLKVTIKKIRGYSVSQIVYERFNELVYEVFINYPIEEATLKGNNELVKFLYPSISVQADRHLFLVRHAKYRYAPNPEDKVLTNEGIEQAHLTGKYLEELSKTYNFIKINSSTMVRAKQTSQCISEHLSELPLNDDDLLCELNTSSIDENNSQIKYAYAKYFRHGITRQNNESLILVCHANLIRAFICKINKVSVENWKKFNLHHGSVTHIVLDRNGEIFCADFNNAMFIPEEKRTYN